MSFEPVKIKTAEGVVDECRGGGSRGKHLSVLWVGCQIETVTWLKGRHCQPTWEMECLFNRWQLLCGWVMMYTLRWRCIFPFPKRMYCCCCHCPDWVPFKRFFIFLDLPNYSQAFSFSLQTCTFNDLLDLVGIQLNLPQNEHLLSRHLNLLQPRTGKSLLA